jgi:hypothetical protein
MLRDIIIFLAGMGVSAVGVCAILFVKLGRENAKLKRHLMRIASGVAHGNAMQQTIHGAELEANRDEFQRTREMAHRDLGIDTDELLGSGS